MIEFKKQLITPSVAKALLEANVFNRRIRHKVVMEYTKEMSEGRWKEDTGELIKVSKTGIILDGQHRLWAVVKSNKPISFHFAYNLEDSIFDVLDTGSVRNASDSFKVKGIPNDNKIPSIIAMYNLLLLGKKMGVKNSDKASTSVLLEQYFTDEIFWQNVAKHSHKWYLSFAKILPPSYFGGFYAYFLKLDSNKAEDFFNQLATGVNIKNEIISMLRNKLMQDKMSPRKMPPTLKMALIIKAWNIYIANKTQKLLKFDSKRDEFPVALSQKNNYFDFN